MKTSRNIKFSAALAALAISTSPVVAATFMWYHGGTDNRASATNNATAEDLGVDEIQSNQLTWMDIFATAGSPDTSFTGPANNDPLDLTRPDLLGRGMSMMVFGFDGIEFDGVPLTSADVTTANLYLRQDSANGNNTWNVVGIPDTDWNNTSVTWNTDGVDGWTGGSTLYNAISGNYGTFDTSASDNGNFISIDITSALQAYLDGQIGGIAFVNDVNGSSFVPSDNVFRAYSSESDVAGNRPGLGIVTSIPEPSGLLLAVTGVFALFRRMRR